LKSEKPLRPDKDFHDTRENVFGNLCKVSTMGDDDVATLEE
jgi:hypothetical protein